jgi:hypothetical protein
MLTLSSTGTMKITPSIESLLQIVVMPLDPDVKSLKVTPERYRSVTVSGAVCNPESFAVYGSNR